MADNVEGAFVAEGWTNGLEQPRHGFNVMGIDLGGRCTDRIQVFLFTGEIGDQEFDAGAGVELMDSPDGFGVEPGSFVIEVVAGHTGHRGIAKTHLLHGLGDLERFGTVQSSRLAGVDLAEVTATGAFRTSNEEGCFAVFPAFENIRATGLFTHRVQALVLDELLHLDIFGADFNLGFDPLGLAFHGGGRVALFNAQHAASFGGEAHSRAPSSAIGVFVLIAGSSRRVSSSCTRSSTSTGRTRLPLSSVMLVVEASAIPHGMIRENAESSLSQFSAKPCMVTPWSTRMPIAAILRS